jgi:histone deacetylase 11
MLLATSGSILAGKVAMERGVGINLGGGYHHCSGCKGGGFCPFADISLSLACLRKNFPSVKKAMIIDLGMRSLDYSFISLM